jgi:hypothetical protein
MSYTSEIKTIISEKRTAKDSKGTVLKVGDEIKLKDGKDAVILDITGERLELAVSANGGSSSRAMRAYSQDVTKA